jgi:RHS repeat-associated protein
MVALAEDKISPADLVDAVNRRIRKTIGNGGLPINIPNGTTDCVWFGWQAMEERNPFGGTGSTDTPIRQYVWGTYIDELVQITTLATLGPQSLPAGAYYLLQDTLYRAVALTDTNGGIVEAYDTDAYGNTLIFTAPGPDDTWFTDDDVRSDYGANEIIYCGYRFDPETENYYVRNRYYAPALGRWLTRDPIGNRGGINLYGYVASSPVGNVDAAGAKLTQSGAQAVLDKSGLGEWQVITPIPEPAGGPTYKREGPTSYYSSGIVYRTYTAVIPEVRKTVYKVEAVHDGCFQTFTIIRERDVTKTVVSNNASAVENAAKEARVVGEGVAAYAAVTGLVTGGITSPFNLALIAVGGTVGFGGLLLGIGASYFETPPSVTYKPGPVIESRVAGSSANP